MQLGFWAVFGKRGVNSWAVCNSGFCAFSVSLVFPASAFGPQCDVYQGNKQPGTCTPPDLVFMDKANDFMQLVSFSERTDLAFCLLHGI